MQQTNPLQTYIMSLYNAAPTILFSQHLNFNHQTQLTNLISSFQLIQHKTQGYFNEISQNIQKINSIHNNLSRQNINQRISVLEDGQHRLLAKALNMKQQLMVLTLKNKREPDNNVLAYNMLLSKIESDFTQITKLLAEIKYEKMKQSDKMQAQQQFDAKMMNEADNRSQKQEKLKKAVERLQIQSSILKERLNHLIKNDKI